MAEDGRARARRPRRFRRWRRTCARRGPARATRRRRAPPRPWRGATSRRSARTTSTRRWRCGRRAAARTCADRPTWSRPRACARSSGACSARCPTSPSRSSRPPPRTIAARCSGASAARSPGRATSAASRRPAIRSTLEGLDLITVRDGLIQSHDAFTDTMTLPRQIGMMPALGSAAEQRLMGAFNATTRVRSSLARGDGRAGGRGRVGGAGPAGALQRVPDRGRRRGDAVRRGHPHDDARGGERRGEARRHPPGGARPRPHRPSRRGAGAGRAGAVPPRGGRGRARAAAAFATGPPIWPACPPLMRPIHRLLHRYAWDGGPVTDLRHRRRGRRAGGLSRRAPARPRARPDRAVARVRPPGAEQRLLLHDRPVGPRLRAARARSPSTTSTPSRRERACASSPRWSPPRRGPGTAGPRPGTCAPSSNGPPTSPERGQAQPPARDRLAAPSERLQPTPLGNVLTLRGSLTAAARREYAQTLAGGRGAAGRAHIAGGRLAAGASSCCSSAWRCAGCIAGAPIERQRELLMRFRAASAEERAWVREALREHCAEHFPDVRAP